MNWLSNILTSSVGRKQLMALSGAGLSGFLIAHLSGNLLIYKGPEAFNGYADWLASLQPWLNLARLGLLAIAVLHIALAFNLSQQNAKARPVKYYYKADSDATMASRSMIYTGVLILFYVIIHLFDFTWADKNVPDGLYGLVVMKFANPLYVLLYVGAMAVLAGHLLHGIQSVFQTMGLNHRTYTPLIKQGAMTFAVVICLGFASIPVYLLLIQGGV